MTWWFLSDNVHFHQAAEISEALVEEQVDFEAMVSRREINRLCLSQAGLRVNFSVFFVFYSGTLIRIMGSAARHINTSTPTWLTFCRGVFGRHVCRGFYFFSGMQLSLSEYQVETDGASLLFLELKE